MKIERLTLVVVVALALAALPGCSASNATTDDKAAVVLSVEITGGPADWPVNTFEDLNIPDMSINSRAKNPSANLSAQQDVTLREWVITPRRTDGGTVASPQWRNYYTVYVPAGGNASLSNYRIYPAEFFRQPPLLHLFPENGGYCPETGQPFIRQAFHVEVFGQTVAGRSISVSFDVTIRFYYGTPEVGNS